MYCRKCGCKISWDDKKCIECGMEVEETEYNGGFWGLVEKEKNVVSAKQEERDFHVMEMKLKKQKELFEREEKKKKKLIKKYNLFVKLSVGIIAVLFVFCLVQTFRISKMEDRKDWIQKKLYAVEEDYKNLEMKYNNLLLNMGNKKAIFWKIEEVK